MQASSWLHVRTQACSAALPLQRAFSVHCTSGLLLTGGSAEGLACGALELPAWPCVLAAHPMYCTFCKPFSLYRSIRNIEGWLSGENGTQEALCVASGSWCCVLVLHAADMDV